MANLRKVAETLAAHGQHDLAREVAGLSLQIKQAADTSQAQALVDALKEQGVVKGVKFDAKKHDGKANVPGVGQVEFRGSSNDDAVFVEFPSFKFKATGDVAATVIGDISKALSKA